MGLCPTQYFIEPTLQLPFLTTLFGYLRKPLFDKFL